MSISWTCECCGESRPNEFIRVYSEDISDAHGFDSSVVKRNVRYCIDRPSCVARAPQIIAEYKQNVTDRRLRSERRQNRRKQKLFDRQQRVNKANELISVIASCGRRFFRYDDRVGQFFLNDSQRVFYRDPWNGKDIYTHKKGEWRGFTQGGTLKSLVEHIRDYILTGKHLHPGSLGPWPEWYCGGDPWGYGEDMEKVRAKARELGMIPPEETSEANC